MCTQIEMLTIWVIPVLTCNVKKSQGSSNLDGLHVKGVCQMDVPKQFKMSGPRLATFQTIFPNKIFLNENLGISSQISLKFVLKDPIENDPSLVPFR